MELLDSFMLMPSDRRAYLLQAVQNGALNSVPFDSTLDSYIEENKNSVMAPL